MKTKKIYKPLLALPAIAGLLLVAGSLPAQDSTAAAQPAVASQGVPQLSPGMPEVLQLMQAQIGESTILAYIKNSSVTYRLSAEQIIYLKQQGASNPILDAMITHTPPTVVATPTSSVTTQPAVTYVQTAPVSTIYYTRDPYYYGGPAYYGYDYGYGYYPWLLPPVSFSFGFGGHGHGGGYGGWHGGGCGGHR